MNVKLLLNPRQSSEISQPDYWHTCPRLEMLEAVWSLSWSQSAGGFPQSPFWWQMPAAAQGNWHRCQFVLEVAVKVTRTSVSVSWNALSWELVIWHKIQNQKIASTPNNAKIKPREGGKGRLFHTMEASLLGWYFSGVTNISTVPVVCKHTLCLAPKLPCHLSLPPCFPPPRN